jgi:hypothetical protein
VGGEPRRRTHYNPRGGLSIFLVSLLDEIIMPERVSNDAEKVCEAHARSTAKCVEYPAEGSVRAG